MGKVSVKALAPIKYMAEGEEAKLYEPGDTFEVLETEVKQLREVGAVEVSDEIAAQLDEEAAAEPVVSAGPTTVPADAPGVAVLENGEPKATDEGTQTPPLVEPSEPPQTSQPTPDEISATLDNL